jgi:hypothetical protein
MGRTNHTNPRFTGEQAPNHRLAAEAGRRNAPLLVGVKKPQQAYMAVWGKRAEMAYRIMLIKAAKKREKKNPQLAALALRQAVQGLGDRKELKDELQRWMEEEEDEAMSYSAELKLALFDSDVDFEREGPWIVTPLRNRMQLRVLQMNGDLEKHPWARFIGWFLQTYVPNGDKAMEAELFSPEQLLVRDGYEVQFMRNEERQSERWSIVVRDSEEMEPEWFDVCYYDRTAEASMERTKQMALAELCRLEDWIKVLEEKERQDEPQINKKKKRDGEWKAKSKNGDAQAAAKVLRTGAEGHAGAASGAAASVYRSVSKGARGGSGRVF